MLPLLRVIRMTALPLGLMLGTVASSRAASEPPSGASTGTQPVRELIERLLPGRSAQFVLERIAPEEGRDVFELETAGGQIVIRGSSGVALASGLNWYLKHYGRCHVSFCGDQLQLADPPPPVPEKVRRASPFRYRYCFNYCAFSYTLAFWDWPQWERMIDWMALHGINMPLAVTGQEAVWYQVYRTLGLNDDEIRRFLVGPAYLPFGWMGCLDGWGGPLPPGWIEQHAALQKKILARQRELGMAPVLQGFTGHVPEALQRVCPQAKFQRLPSWCGFPGTSFLDPLDPLFARIGQAFIEEQTRQFGTDHLYASDTFIEMSPPSSDPQFLAAMGQAVYRAMQAGDPQAVWVMQGWVFINNPKFWKPPQNQALLGAVPKDRLILLDLMCESNPAWTKTDAFYGKPWVWCIIQSFGAQVSLHAGLPQISENLQAALTSPQRGELAGVGLIMEGFGYNPVVYDFVTEMAWHRDVPPLDTWLPEFVASRYGCRSAAADEAWQLLRETAYSQPGQAGSLLCQRPRLGLGFGTSYDPAQLASAWEKLLAGSAELGGADTYRYDLANVARQVLTNLAAELYADLVEAWQRQDQHAVTEAGQRLLGLLDDMDQLLGTRREFLLGPWLADAKRWAANDAERRLYEWNARTLITLWGPRDSILHEYSQREWSGMLRGFYRPRWERLLRAMDQALAKRKPLDAQRLEDELRDFDLQWTQGTEDYPTVPQGDTVAVAARLWDKYRPLILRPQEAISLTTGKPASCSSSLPPYPARLANDGRRSSTDRYWATDVHQDPDPWWQVDLEQPTTVGRVVVVLYYGDARHYGFTVEGSTDGQTWELLADHRANQDLSTRRGHTCSFPPRSIRYLRVRVPHNSANTGRHLVEVLAFEH